MIFEEQYFRFILLTGQILLPSCIYFVRYWVICVLHLFITQTCLLRVLSDSSVVSKWTKKVIWVKHLPKYGIRCEHLQRNGLSSVPSPQSSVPSQSHLLFTQFLFMHWYSYTLHWFATIQEHDKINFHLSFVLYYFQFIARYKK